MRSHRTLAAAGATGGLSASAFPLLSRHWRSSRQWHPANQLGQSSRWVRAALALGLLTALAAGADGAPEAREILDATGVKGGLIVHVGCGDGKLTAALRASDSYLVHGLDADAANVEKARRHIRSLGLAGKVTVEQWTGSRLPYIDNLVNLLVARDLGAVEVAEVMRVLAPDGVAYVKKGGTWVKTVKPRPRQIDEWTHYLHDAGGNAVAKDTVAGPPRNIQWLAAPRWSRHHHTLDSISSVVSARGRIFAIIDEGPDDDMRVPGKWSLVARDAFNGVLLWKQPIPAWAWHRKGFRSGPVQLPRTLVAEGDRVYAPLGIAAPVTALDAATGEAVRTYKGTENTEEIVLSGGVLLVVTGSPMAEQAAVDPALRGKATYPNRKTIHAMRAETGDELWKWSEAAANPVPLTLAADGSRVFFESGKGVVCLNLNTGKELWNSRPAEAAKPEPRKTAKAATTAKDKKGKRKPKSARSVGWSLATLVVHDGVVLLADGGKLSALSAADGKPLWNCPAKPGFRSPADVFVAEGLVWLGPDFAAGRDLHTGEVTKTNNVIKDLWTAGHHHRCYREKATVRYIMTAKRGIEFLDLLADNHSRNNWVRGTCQYGIMPCNGLVYAPSHACGCFMEALLHGFWALAPERRAKAKTESESGTRLERGPAFEEIRNPQSAIRNRDDWPTLRGNTMRSGATHSAVPAQLKEAWAADVGGAITQPVIADGRLLVASVDTHTVHALDARTGKPLWTYTAGGRVDSPPTVYKGLALFGCADGWVYCLRLSDGKPAWRRRAAPGDTKTVAMDQVESVWPVHGNVLVHQGTAYFAAGRSSWLDGGITLYGLEPATGKVVHRSSLRSAHPRLGEGKDENAAQFAKRFVQNATDYKTFKASDRSDAFSIGEGGTTDVLVAGGESVFMRHLRFDAKLEKQNRMMPHLFSTSGLLDGAENHRSHWVYGTGDFSRVGVAYSWIAFKPGNFGSQLSVPYGLLLAFDGETVWGVRRAHLMRWNLKGTGRYTLFAEKRPKPSTGEAHLPDFRKPAGKGVMPFQWTASLSMRPRAMLKAGKLLLLGGMADAIGGQDPSVAPKARAGGLLWSFAAGDGSKVSECNLPSPPVWDGMAVANGRLFIALQNGRILCLGKD